MAKLRIVSFDGGDSRSSATVGIEVENNGGLKLHVTILQDGEIEFTHAKKGNVVWVHPNYMPAERSWVGKQYPGSEFRSPGEPQKSMWDLIWCLNETPAMEPINSSHSRAFSQWEKDMHAMQKEWQIEDFEDKDVGCEPT